MTSRIAIIPARGGSKRLPRKNILPFHNGNPIIYYPIHAAKDSGLFDEIIVSSDDPEILDYATNCGATPSKRPERLSGDDVSEIEAYRFVLNWVRNIPEYFCAIYPTAAFLTGNDIIKAYHHLVETEADVCMGVNKFQHHPYQTLLKNPFDGFYNLRFPDLNEEKYPDAYASNGSLYFFKTNSFIKNPCYYPDKLAIFETKNVDINTEADFKKAQEEWKKDHT